MKSFRMAGDLGDLCLSLPVVRHFGGGIMYLETAKYTREPMTPQRIKLIEPLLRAQPYISDVRPWRGEPCDYNLNDFRAVMGRSHKAGKGFQTALVDWFLDTFQVPRTAKDEPWLTVEAIRVKPVVFSRSGPGRRPEHVYHNSQFPWHRVWQKYGRDAVFVGLPEEHEEFCATCGEVDYQPTEDLLQVAQVIAGADLFVGNQSCPHAIAESLKKRIVLEVWKQGPNCLAFRPDVIHGWSADIKLPDL